MSDFISSATPAAYVRLTQQSYPARALLFAPNPVRYSWRWKAPMPVALRSMGFEGGEKYDRITAPSCGVYFQALSFRIEEQRLT